MLRQMFDTRMGHMCHCLQQRFPLAVYYLFLRDIHRVSLWVALAVLLPSSLYYVMMHHAMPALLRDFLAKPPDEQQALLKHLDTLTMPSWESLLTTALTLALPILLLLFLGRLALQSQRQRSVMGADALIGLQGRARTPVVPGGEGQIDIRGEIWRAESAVALEPGTAVRVLAVNGLTLMVEPAGAATRQGAD